MKVQVRIKERDGLVHSELEMQGVKFTLNEQTTRKNAQDLVIALFGDDAEIIHVMHDRG